MNEVIPLQRLAGSFSTAVLRAVARGVVDPSAIPRLSGLQALSLSPGATVGDAFGAAFDLLAKGYRNEYVFKNLLVSKVVFGRHSPRTATALLEQPMGASEADVLVLNGTSTVYEIKTDYDGLGRLERQLDDYSRYSEFVNVLASDRRVSAIEKRAPRHVGVLALGRSGRLSVVREPRSTLDRLDSATLFELLRTSEALACASMCLGYEVDVPRGHLRARLREVFGRLDVVQTHRLVVDALRTRGSSARELVQAPGFPTSLRALAYGTQISQVGTRRVLDFLSLPTGIMAG